MAGRVKLGGCSDMGFLSRARSYFVHCVTAHIMPESCQRPRARRFTSTHLGLYMGIYLLKMLPWS